MAFMDTISSVAKNITEATGDAIDSGKLTAKKSQEISLAEDELRKIGRVYYDRYIQTGVADDFVLEYLSIAKQHYEAAAKAQNEKDRINSEAHDRRNAPVEPEVGKYCTVCGTKSVMDAAFCTNCGHQF